jgi:hypothetical protein
MSTTQQLRAEAARKSEALYTTEKYRRPLVWGHLCEGFEAGYLSAGTLYGTSLIQAQERINTLESYLDRIATGAAPYNDREAWSWIETARQLANEALSPNTVKDKEDE